MILRERLYSVIRLLSAFLRVSKVESQAIRADLTHLLSPQMGKDIVLFLKRWPKTYLLVDEKLYDWISLPFSTAFRAGTEGSQWIIGYLLQKQDLVNDIVQLLVTLMERRERAILIIQCENWWNLAKQAEAHLLISCQVLSHMDMETKQQYWTEVLQPLQHQAGNHCHTGGPVWHFYKNTPETVNLIIVFIDVTHKQICYFEESKAMNLYEACLTLMQVHSKNNLGWQRIDVTAEEEQYQDLLLIMELLTNLLSKEFIDFSDTDEVFRGHEPGQATNRSVSAADVGLYGVKLILSMMSQDLLKFPTLFNQYYKLITFICEIFPEKIPQLPEDLFKSLMYSLKLGMTSMSSEVCQPCLEALTPLAELCAKAQETDSPLFLATRRFLKLVVDMLVLQKHNTELTTVAGEAFYTLMCLHQAEYSELVETLLSSQQSPVIYQRSADAFNKFTASSTPPMLDRKQKMAFSKSLEEFMKNKNKERE
uniref:Exportin-4 n=1 Tax=Aotus nancymaae TaxID=37293 RepID=A0A2K5BW38_AOTNA